jgi:hypothetical protein
MDTRFASLGYVQLSSAQLASAIGLASVAPVTAITAGGVWIAQGAIFRCEAQNVRWRDDGTAPTGAVGQLILPGDLPFYYSGALGAIQFIYAAAGAILNVTFIR